MRVKFSCAAVGAFLGLANCTAQEGEFYLVCDLEKTIEARNESVTEPTTRIFRINENQGEIFEIIGDSENEECGKYSRTCSRKIISEEEIYWGSHSGEGLLEASEFTEIKRSNGNFWYELDFVIGGRTFETGQCRREDSRPETKNAI